jgi:sugar phosphate isomerase/epimerase
MKFGFMTNVLVKNGMKTLPEIASWAVSHGFTDLEVGPTVPLDQRISEEVMENTGIRISTLTYCRNFLSHQEEERETHRKELVRRIHLAGELGIEKVVTSTGIDKSVEEGVYDKADSIRKIPERSLEQVVDFFGPVLELCEKEHVRLAFENCPLMGNIAISPYMWRKLFSRLDSKMVGLCYDPSHLVWEGIGFYQPLEEFREKIFHFHAKDTLIMKEKLEDTGILTNFDWWRYVIPGHGTIDWKKMMGCLKAIGYEGTISVEHEDADYDGSLEKVQEGIVQAKACLASYV